MQLVFLCVYVYGIMSYLHLSYIKNMLLLFSAEKSPCAQCLLSRISLAVVTAFTRCVLAVGAVVRVADAYAGTAFFRHEQPSLRVGCSLQEHCAGTTRSRGWPALSQESPRNFQVVADSPFQRQACCLTPNGAFCLCGLLCDQFWGQHCCH